jgi:hypothetical protein
MKYAPWNEAKAGNLVTVDKDTFLVVKIDEGKDLLPVYLFRSGKAVKLPKVYTTFIIAKRPTKSRVQIFDDWEDYLKNKHKIDQ